MLLNFVPAGHLLELTVPPYPAASVPRRMRFFIVHVVYSPQNADAALYVYEHGREAFITHHVAFGR